MKFSRCIIFFLLLHITTRSQEGSYTLTPQTAELATYIPTATPVSGQQYQFPDNIHSYYPDPANNELIILLKKEKEVNFGSVGELLVFDMNKNTVKWSNKIYSFDVFITSKHIITSNGNTTTCHYRSNGKQAWKKMDARLKYIDEQKGLVLTDYIRALDINTGKARWQKYMPVKYNWEDVEVLNDSAVLVAAGGLYNINLYTGKGWNTNEITAKSEFDIPSSVGIIPPAPKFPSISIPEINNETDIWRGTTSGLLIDGNNIYFATNQRLLSIDKETGKLNWEAKLPNEKTGITSLYIVADNIVILNEGKISGQAGIYKKYGSPYIASFNKANGSQNYIEEIQEEGNLNDIVASGNKLTLLFDKSVYQHDLENNKEIPASVKGNPNYHFIQTAYSFSGDENENKDMSDKCCYIYRGGDQLEFFDVNSQASYELSTKDIASPVQYGDILLLYNGKNMVLRNNETILKTPDTNQGFVSNNKLYILNANTLSVVPIEEPK